MKSVEEKEKQWTETWERVEIRNLITRKMSVIVCLLFVKLKRGFMIIRLATVWTPVNSDEGNWIGVEEDTCSLGGGVNFTPNFLNKRTYIFLAPTETQETLIFVRLFVCSFICLFIHPFIPNMSRAHNLHLLASDSSSGLHDDFRMT